jgi:hypothetical protein
LIKNKVFFAETFGFLVFYIYIFSGLGTAEGVLVAVENHFGTWCFPRGIIAMKSGFRGKDGNSRPFFMSCHNRFLLLQWPVF